MPGQERTDTGEGAGDERATLETSPASNHAATRADEATADDAAFNALSTTFGLTRWRKLARGAKEVGRKAARRVSKRMIKLLDMSLPYRVVVALFCVLILANVLIGLVLKYAVDPFYSNPNNERPFHELDSEAETYRDISKTVIPDLKKWYRSRPTGSTLLEPRNWGNATPAGVEAAAAAAEATTSPCIQYWTEELAAATGNMTHTDPAWIRRISEHMGFLDNPTLARSIRPLLDEPVAIAPMVQAGAECASVNPGYVAMACAAKNDETMRPWYKSIDRTEQRRELRRAMNFAVLMDELTKRAAAELSVAMQLATLLLHDKREAIMRTIDTDPNYSPAYRKFVRMKYTGIAQSYMRQTLERMRGANANASESEMIRIILQLNILEAAWFDMVQGLVVNTGVGVALAARTLGYRAITDHRLTHALGSEWVQSYHSWNFAYTYSLLDMTNMPKLLIPSVSCLAVPAGDAETWIFNRLTSLSMTMLYDSLAVSTFDKRPTPYAHVNPALARKMGEVNRAEVQLSEPTKDMAEEMFYNACLDCHDYQWRQTDTGPSHTLSGIEFKRYLGTVTWLTVLLSGLGSEVMLGSVYIKKLIASSSGETMASTQLEAADFAWKYAQFLFPICATISLGGAMHQSFFALPFLVVGLWKFGFPETFMYVFMFMNTRKRDVSLHTYSDFLNGAGTLLHHGAASYLICLMVCGVVPGSRPVIDSILPLVMQHWFVLTRYVSKNVYVIIELFLEAVFEWQIFSNFELYYRHDFLCRHCAAVMLLAHWLYLAASACETLHHGFTKREKMADDKEWGVTEVVQTGLQIVTNDAAAASDTTHHRERVTKMTRSSTLLHWALEYGQNK